MNRAFRSDAKMTRLYHRISWSTALVVAVCGLISVNITDGWDALMSGLFILPGICGIGLLLTLGVYFTVVRPRAVPEERRDLIISAIGAPLAAWLPAAIHVVVRWM